MSSYRVNQCIRILFTAGAAAALVGCPSPVLKDTPRPPPGPNQLGWQCLPTPSEWNIAGTVIEVWQNEIRPMGTVPDLKPQIGEAIFPNFSSESSISSGIALSTMQGLTTMTGVDAKLGFDAKKSVTMTTSYGGNVKRATLLGQPRSAADVWFKKGGFVLEDQRHYYLVLESILATEVTYSIKRDNLAKLGGEAQVRDMVKGTATIFDNKENDSLDVKAKSTNPLNVCIRPVELVFSSGADGKKAIVGTRDVTTLILKP